MLKEKVDLIINDLKFEKYDNIEIADMIEISYFLGNNTEYLEKYAELNDEANDGINTYGLFVKFCYDKYSERKYWDIYDFLQCETENCIKEFKEKYFEEIK